MLRRIARAGLARVRRSLRGTRLDPGLDLVNIWSGQSSAAATASYWPRAEVERIRRGLTEGATIFGLLRTEIAIGEAARRLTRAIRTTPYPCATRTISIPEVFKEPIAFEADDALRQFDTALLVFNADTLVNLLRADKIVPRDLVGRRRIGFWHWELPVFPANFAPAFDLVDEIWAPSTFVAASIAPLTAKPVRIVPHAVPSPEIDRAQARRELDLPADAMIYLTTFDFNSRLARKNPLGAIRAFRDAFPSPHESGPILVVKCHGQNNFPESYREIKAQCDADPRIRLITEIFSSERISLLQAACDALISLHRGEGFGLNPAECMALGKIVIATAFSGNMDFMNAGNSLLVPYQPRPLEKDEYIFGDGQWWAEPDHAAAVEALRRAASRASDVLRLAENARTQMRRDYSYEQIGRIAVEALRGTRKPFVP